MLDKNVGEKYREPMSVIIRRDFSGVADPTLSLKLICAIEKENQSILSENATMSEYKARFCKNY